MNPESHFLPEADLEQLAMQASRSLRDLDGARIFVTGGTGFFGIWLLEALAWACRTRDLKLDIVVLSRAPVGFCERFPHLAANPRLRFVAGDVRTFTPPHGHFDFVVHAAADVHASALCEDALTAIETAIEGTRRVLDLARTSGVRSFLLVSSGAVYGPQRVKRVPEERIASLDPLQPSSAYALAKQMSEHLAALYHHGFGVPVKIARCFAFLGPGMPLDGHFAAGNFFRVAVHDEPIQVLGHRETVRSYLYPSDLIAWLLAILTRGGTCRPYNVGSEDEVTIETLARLISDTSPSHPRVIVRDCGGGRPCRYVPSTARITQELACRQTVTLGDAVSRMWSWLSANRAEVASRPRVSHVV